MTSGDGFRGREFYDRPLTGLRAFALQAGVLTGVYKRQAYVSGENLARCLVPPFRMAARVEPVEPHEVAAKECVCGFHAYYDGNNSYMAPGLVAGLIEGYGLLTVGAKGFRASKARIVAIVVPDILVEGFLTAICDTYPGVPLYDTQAAALAAHPLTPIDIEVTS